MNNIIPDNFIQTPSIIYKYRPWTIYCQKGKKLKINENTIKILKNNEIYFSTPSELNDPFDCSIPIKYDSKVVEEKQLRAVMTKLLLSEEPGMNTQNATNTIMSISYSKLIEIINKKLEKLKYITNDLYKVFSSSRLSLNQLMWSHYSNSHSGICIGLDCKLIYNGIVKDPNIKIIPGHVEYQKEYPTIDEIIHPTMLEQARIDLAKKILFTKGNSWKYEKEYRLVVQSKKPINLKLPKDCFKSFHLGLNIGREKDILIKIIREEYPNSQIFQVEMSKEKFQLVRKQIR